MATGPTPNAEHLLQHAAFVRAVAAATLRGDDLVDDVVQETWLAALSGGRRRRGPLAPWLAGVVRNQARSLLRKRKADRSREQRVARPERVSPQQEVVDRLEIERRLIRAVEALPEHFRTPLVLRYLDDLPPRVIALRLSLPVDTVRTRVRRGLARLRAGLEADHGGQARDWRLALLPLLPANASFPNPVVTASGGLLMAKKILLPILALVLLAGGVALFVVEGARPSSPGRSDGAGETRAQARHPASAPALVGRSGSPARDHVAEPHTREDPARPAGASEAENGAASGDAMRALLAEIRRDVAPEWWSAYPELGALEGRNGVVIARAPPDVLDAIMRDLEARRAGDPGGAVEPAPVDVRAVEATRAALRPILRGILEREQKIDSAIAAWESGHLAEAKTMAEEVLAEEPDNAFAEAIRRETAAGKERRVTGDSTRGEFDRTRLRFRDARGQQTLQAWVMRWPSVRTWKALTAILADANLGEFRRVAPQIDTLLDRGSVTLDVGDASLTATVRRLQIETFADIRLSEGAKEEAGRIRVQDFREEARSLREVLEALVMRLPEGWTFIAARQHVVITRTRDEGAARPETRLRYFDVKDLLVPGSVPPGGSTLTEPGTPPVPPLYRPDASGGAPVRVPER